MSGPRSKAGVGTLSDSRRALWAAAATGVLVGSGIVASRGVVELVGPVLLALLRYTVGLVCLLPVLALAPRVRIAPADIVPIGLLGIGQFGVLIVLLNIGLQSVPSAQAAVLFATLPLLTLLLAARLGHERLSMLKILSVLLSILSVLSVLSTGVLGALSSASLLGSLAVLASAACGAVCSVLYRPYLRRYPTLPLSALAMFAAVLFLAGLALLQGALTEVPRLPLAGWVAIGFVGVSSAAGYYLWLWALSHINATRVTVFLALSPITASLFGVLVLHESLSVWSIAGVGGVVLSLWLIQADAS